jgi:hypothetical protein
VVSDLWLSGFKPIAECASRELVAALAPAAGYKWPIMAFPQQNLTPVVSAATTRRDLPVVGGEVMMLSPSRLDMFTIRNGYFAIGSGHDGMVFTGAGEGVREACLFSTPSRERATSLRIGEINDTIMDEVFLGFDGGWSNWFHWICFALAKSSIAAERLSPACQIVLPERTPSTGTTFSHAAWQQSIAAFGLDGRVTSLPPGIYRARAIHLLWTDTVRASDIIPFGCFARVFERLQRQFRPDPDAPTRIFAVRDRVPDPRLDPAEQALLRAVAVAHGFQPVYFEAMDFAAQADSLFNAELAMGVHGAGLTNILFGREALGVLEINRNLDGPVGGLRPWFYMLANSRGQRYMTLDRDLGELTKPRLDAAIEALTASL